MGRFRRKHAILIAAAGLIASTAALIGLRIGRPVYYSDGSRTFAASDLRHAGMLRWGAPRPEFALPGPIRGRVAQLPDGRLLYGRVRSRHRTDLVLFDPGLPAQDPAPVLALCSEGHDLAPAVRGHRVFFASDRAGGAGGFDLYRARYRDGTFLGVAPVEVPGVNTALDETDPAPDPVHDQLVFVRRDPGRLEGRNATLWVASLSGADGFEPRALLPPEEQAAQVLPALDRDPAFLPGGKALYFLRQRPLEEPVLMQTFPHRGRWVQPLPVEIRTTTTLRGPAPLAAGFELRLVGSGAETLTYRSRAREVRPYWDGQAWIERLLVSLSLFFLALLVLLTLGARWHQLDLITRLFLVSVAIHLLLLLWLSRMEIVRSFLPDVPEPGQLEVRILATGPGERAPGTGELVARNEDLSRQAAFQPRESALEATAPGAEIQRVQRTRQAGLPEPARPELRPTLPAVARDLAGAPATVSPRTGRSQEPAVSPTAMARARPDRAQDLAARQLRQQHARTTLQVATPGSDLPSIPRSVAGPSQRTARTPLPRPDLAPPPTGAIQDAPAPPAPHRATARLHEDHEDIAPLAGNRAAPAATAPAVAARRPGTSETPPERARPGGSLLARNRSEAHPPPATPEAGTVPMDAAKIDPGEGACRDALPAQPKPAAGTAASPVAESPGSSLQAVAQAAPGTAPERHPARPPATDVPSPPSPFALLGAVTGRRRPGPPAPGTIPGKRAFPDLAQEPVRDLPDTPETANGPGTRTAPATTPFAAALPELGPGNAPSDPVRRRPRQGGGLTGGLRIPGSLLERADRRPPLPASSAPLTALDQSLFRNRFGPRKEAALEKYGGGEETERAVRLGLDYLARIQNQDGSWGRRSRHRKYGRVQVGKTALCLLAFLGAGHTHQSQSQHQEAARKALEFLLRVQDEATGHFGATSTYSHGIATYALAECCAMTRDKKLVAPLEYAVAWTLVNQDHGRDRRSRGGWGYFSPSLRPEDGYARASTTAWQVMALKSARLSGIKVAEEHLRLAEQFLWRCYDRRHRYFLYTHKPSRLRSSWRTLPASTPAACFCLMLLGNDPGDDRLEAGLHYTLDRRPRRYARHSNNQFVRRGAGNVYFWYYGSLAAFLAGGKSWRQWNRALKGVLLPAQSEDGSFQPIDVYAEYAGDHDKDRSYTTAMCVLSLEVYYRYFTPLLRAR